MHIVTITRMSDFRDRIRTAIEADIYVSATDESLADGRTGLPRESGWIFDFRRVIFRKDILEAVAHAFWETFETQTSLQVCGLESAALPIVAGISLTQPDTFDTPMHAVYMRKSRKKDGLMRMIEGTPAGKDVPFVLVDDILNSGKTFIRQVEVLEALGYRVSALWTILRFRDADFYDYFENKGIAVHSLFELNDFADTLDTHNLEPRHHAPLRMPFRSLWKFASDNPNYFHVVSKSNPVHDDTKIYMGSDSGNFWAINQHDGSIAWKYKVGFHAKGKSIFSSPALHDGTVFFGAYDGNVYALDTDTGKKKWVFWEADYIGSSPTLAPELGLVFVGLEFGLIKKRGGIAALDIHTGKKVWEYSMQAYTHSSPYYLPRTKQVVVGGNEGIVYLFNAKTGALVWEFATGATTEEERVHGFSRFDIKESFAYDAETDAIYFGNSNALFFALNRKTGEELWRFDGAQFGFLSTPYVYKDTVITTSLDKHVYCLDKHTGAVRWTYHAGARIFASPTVINNRVYVGSNTGRLVELDPDTGTELAFITVPERITNTVIYNDTTKRYFLPTFANELYCLERDDT